jgi:hypothetical protein
MSCAVIRPTAWGDDPDIYRVLAMPDQKLKAKPVGLSPPVIRTSNDMTRRSHYLYKDRTTREIQAKIEPSLLTLLSLSHFRQLD